MIWPNVQQSSKRITELLSSSEPKTVLPSSPDIQKTTDGATPLMAQYLAIKAQHPHCLLFFRLGDFYELFFDDAVTAARALDITLTRRGQHQGQDVPMCGVPFHAYESYMAKLIRKGFHVALCEQTEDPAEAKKRGGKAIVTREVVRIITPGTATEDSLLEATAANLLACIGQTGEGPAVAWIDLARCEPVCETIALDGLSALLARLAPSEILIADTMAQDAAIRELLAPWHARLTKIPAALFGHDKAARTLQKIYAVAEHEALGSFSRRETIALGTLIDYLTMTQRCDLSHLARPRAGAAEGGSLIMDAATRRNLEITRTLSGERDGSLLAAIDRTLTSAGARLLTARLAAPLTDISAINRRLDSVEAALNDQKMRQNIRQSLARTTDLERALARLSLGRGGPRDLGSVATALKQARDVRAAILLPKTPESMALTEAWQALGKDLGEHDALIDLLSRALRPDLPLLARDGGFITRGYHPPLDALLDLRDESRQLIANLQQKYAAASGVSGLKIKHNLIIGYHIEVAPSHADKLLAQKEAFIHRQTLASAVRFTTVELSEMDRKIAEAADKALALELELFAALVGAVMDRLAALRRTADALAQADVTTALAELAAMQNYARPIIDDSLAFDVKGGRHPVVESALARAVDPQPFIANDCDLGPTHRLWLLTGPNMAGKSTFLRQNALICLLAQMGGFVPARSARIGIVDRLFSRVGAADDLARGQSTFMVEMVETAAILNQASERAFVILDEIGRGTATYDGLSIAWATLEHLHEINRCRTLFATHYHELTELSKRLPHLACATMRIREWEHDIVFLHEVVAGTADRSYGIHVAQMAGLPSSVIDRAHDVLKRLENDKKGYKSSDFVSELPLFDVSLSKPVMNPTDSALLEAIRSLNPDNMTPKEALDAIYKLKKGDRSV